MQFDYAPVSDQDVVEDKFTSDLVEYTFALGEIHEDVTFYDMKDADDKKVDAWINMPSFRRLNKVTIRGPVKPITSTPSERRTSIQDSIGECVRVLLDFSLRQEEKGIRRWEITFRFPTKEEDKIYKFAALMIEMSPNDVVLQDDWQRGKN